MSDSDDLTPLDRASNTTPETNNFESPSPEEVNKATAAPKVEEPAKPFSMWGGIQSIVVAAFLLASLFTLFSPTNLFSGEMLERAIQAWRSNPDSGSVPDVLVTAEANTLPIGIVAGHWKNDSGAVCPDGLTEAEVNLKIATLVQQNLINEGYKVDLLEEFDERLSLYKGIALVSIHADTCEPIHDEASGFKVAAAVHSVNPEKASRLTLCMADRFQSATGLTYMPNSSSNDMTYYHAFDEIHSETTAVIIETGFLNLDRQILTEKPELIAEGISNGLLCFIRNEKVSLTEETQTP
ncbi:MAG: N-acetylmuramoyl-L-alanine amidase [Anaerolineaceae bacterium]|nr:N-acetylmuramoyl-L-alanine amidase [Anaerolineaceae bacterium]